MTLENPVHTKPEQDSDIYTEPNARSILQYLLRNISTTISPQVQENDDVTYPQVPTIAGASIQNVDNLLSRMSAAGVLLADLADKVPVCPECASRELSSRYLCPRCLSFDITRSFLFEHLKCGKVAGDDSFRKNGELICPKCQTVLHNYGVEYRTVGAWYKCNHCGNSFSAATHSHFCRPKHHQFTPDRARLEPIYSYRINTNILHEIRKKVLLFSDLVTAFEDLGLTVFASHSLPSKSGSPRSFDIVIIEKGRWGAQKTVAIDFLKSESGIGVEAIREFASKVKDTKPTASFLIAVPKLADDARGLARNLKLTCIEAPTPKEAVEAVQSQGAVKELLA